MIAFIEQWSVIRKFLQHLAPSRCCVAIWIGLYGRYVASGYLAYVRGSTLFAVPFDLVHLAVVGQEVPLVEGISTMGPQGSADYAVSDAGTLVYLTGDSTAWGTTLAWVDRKGTTHELPGQSTARWGTGRPSPDGRRLANTIDDGSTGCISLAPRSPRRRVQRRVRMTEGRPPDFPTHRMYTPATERREKIPGIALICSGSSAIAPSPSTGRVLCRLEPGNTRFISP